MCNIHIINIENPMSVICPIMLLKFSSDDVKLQTDLTQQVFISTQLA